jgi:hypothetical protein
MSGISHFGKVYQAQEPVNALNFSKVKYASNQINVQKKTWLDKIAKWRNFGNCNPA